jgi:hypothetical protein
MEIYNRLPEDLQWQINKLYMTNFVLSEIKEHDCEEHNMCGNCAFHGFPCLNCADYTYHGSLGPGYAYGKRYLITNDFPNEYDHHYRTNEDEDIIINDYEDEELIHNNIDQVNAPAPDNIINYDGYITQEDDEDEDEVYEWTKLQAQRVDTEFNMMLWMLQHEIQVKVVGSFLEIP